MSDTRERASGERGAWDGCEALVEAEVVDERRENWCFSLLSCATDWFCGTCLLMILLILIDFDLAGFFNEELQTKIKIQFQDFRFNLPGRDSNVEETFLLML